MILKSNQIQINKPALCVLLVLQGLCFLVFGSLWLVCFWIYWAFAPLLDYDVRLKVFTMDGVFLFGGVKAMLQSASPVVPNPNFAF